MKNAIQLLFVLLVSGCATLPEGGTWEGSRIPTLLDNPTERPMKYEQDVANCELQWLRLRAGAPALNNAISLATAAVKADVGPVVALVTHLLRWDAQKRDASDFISACMIEKGYPLMRTENGNVIQTGGYIF